jgi:hypothetical protein
MKVLCNLAKYVLCNSNSKSKGTWMPEQKELGATCFIFNPISLNFFSLDLFKWKILNIQSLLYCRFNHYETSFSAPSLIDRFQRYQKCDGGTMVWEILAW